MCVGTSTFFIYFCLVKTEIMELHKFERQLRLMMMLTQNRNYTLEELGKRLDMSARNVYRYIETFKMAGFVVRKRGKFYYLDKSSPYFKDITSLVHFTEEEAYVLKRAIESIDGNTSMKQELKQKLYKVYDYKILSDIVVRNGMGDNVHFLYEAIKEKKQVVFHQYKSSNSHAVSNRVVEPFAFTPNNSEIWSRCRASDGWKCLLHRGTTKTFIRADIRMCSIIAVASVFLSNCVWE